MATSGVGPSKRAIAARQNGRLGGLATAKTHSAEFLEQRSSKAGSANRDRYGSDYYRFLVSLRKRNGIKNPKVLPLEPVKQSTTQKRLGLMLQTVQRQLA